MFKRRLYPLLFALAICAFFAVMEGIFAGEDIVEQYSSLRLPAYSPPFWAWFIIGGLYYLICFAILFRIFYSDSKHKRIALLLLFLLMAINTTWNTLLLAGNSYDLAFYAFLPYDLVAIALFITLLKVDRIAACAFSPYLFYLVYVNLWGYDIWQMNG